MKFQASVHPEEQHPSLPGEVWQFEFPSHLVFLGCGSNSFPPDGEVPLEVDDQPLIWIYFLFSAIKIKGTVYRHCPVIHVTFLTAMFISKYVVIASRINWSCSSVSAHVGGIFCDV